MKSSAFSAIYAICVGAMMILMWSVFLATGQVPELTERPAEITLHLVDEFATALLLLLAGISARAGRTWGSMLLLPALGMLLYTLVVSPGYYIRTGTAAMVVMFAVLLVLAVVAVALQISRLLKALR